MSLINEALKRAKDAQQKSQSAPAGPQFRPAEPAPEPKRGMGMTVPLVIAVFAIGGVVLLWRNLHMKVSGKATTNAQPVVTAAPTPETKPAVPAAAIAPAPAAPIAATPAPVPAPVQTALTPAPDLKLQAIFFSPGNSSAIISGKTVRVGNVLKGFRVAAITEVSATLVSGTQTNVMTLEQ